MDYIQLNNIRPIQEIKQIIDNGNVSVLSVQELIFLYTYNNDEIFVPIPCRICAIDEIKRKLYYDDS